MRGVQGSYGRAASEMLPDAPTISIVGPKDWFRKEPEVFLILIVLRGAKPLARCATRSFLGTKNTSGYPARFHHGK